MASWALLVVEGAVERVHDHGGVPFWVSVPTLGVLHSRVRGCSRVVSVHVQHSRKMLFHDLPTEILDNLLQMLAYTDILSCREVRIYSLKPAPYEITRGFNIDMQTIARDN